MNMDVTVQVGSGATAQMASLADLAGIELAQVEANFGFAPTPAGTYVFRVKSTELVAKEMTPRGETEKITVPAVVFIFSAVNCLNLNDKTKDPASYVDVEHMETFFIRDLQQDLGRCRALMESAGLQMIGSFQDLLDGFIGTEFTAVITNRADKNDKDRIYANLNLKMVAPHGGGDAVGMAMAPPPVAAPVASVAPAPVQQVDPAAGINAAPATGGFSLNK